MAEEGGLQRLSAPELLPGNEYYERIGTLQQRLRESERKRMELERKLFDYSRLDMCRAHRRYAKLKQSLKEICEWEKRAQLRNQEFLREFDQIEAHIMTFTANKDKLQNMKILQTARQAGINSGTSMSSGLYHPATIFMGRQMSATSSTEHFSIQQKASKSTKTYSVSDPYSFRLAGKNGKMIDSCVIQTNSDMQCLNNTDKIDGRTSWQISEKVAVTSTLSTENGKIHLSELGNIKSIQNNLIEIKQSASLNSQLLERLISENRNKNLKSDNIMNTVEDALGYKTLVVNKDQDNLSSPVTHDYKSERSLNKGHMSEKMPENNKNLDTLWPMQITEHLDKSSLDSGSSSDLTVSLSDTEEEISATKPLQNQEDEENLPEVLRSLHTENEKEVDPNRGNTSPLHVLSCLATEEETLITSTSQDCLSVRGFLHLVQSIEDMVLGTDSKCLGLYKNTVISTAKLKEIICLCNQTETLKEEDLETCAAVVLQQSRLKGCLLPEDEKHVRSSLQPDFSVLWERLCKHVIFLKECNILSKDVIVRLFGSLLMVDDNQEDSKTKVLLKKALEEESVFECSVHRSESMCSLPSSLNDSSEIKPGKQAQCLDNNRTREQAPTGDRNTQKHPKMVPSYLSN